MNRERLLAEHVLLPLIELLRSDDDVLLLAVAKALINLSSGNLGAKDSIVNEGGVRALVPHLLNKTEELTRAFCVLLKNCLTAAELRERIVNGGAVAPLIKLLHKTEIRDAHRSESVVSAAAAAVWNLSAHEVCRPHASLSPALDGSKPEGRISRGIELRPAGSASWPLVPHALI